MNGIGKIFIVLAALVCIIPMASAAIAVGNIAMTPSGDLISGETHATATFVVNFPISGGRTFDDSNTLQMDTELANPTWTYSIILDGIEPPTPKTEVGPNIRISGWELSYPSDREVSINVRVEGTAPMVQTSEEKIVLRVRETDSRNSAISSSEVVKKKLVINPSQVQGTIATAKSALGAVRDQLDQLAASGVDTSSADSKYSQAQSLLQNAERESNYSKAAADTSSALKILDELKTLMQQLETQKAISDANTPIDQTDQIVTYLKVNKSMASDPRIAPIITKMERAKDLVVDARDLLSEGKFQEATVKAGEAGEKGREALSDAEALRKEVDSNPLAAVGGVVGGAVSGSLTTIIIIIVVAVIAVGGFLLYRRRRHWDELG